MKAEMEKLYDDHAEAWSRYCRAGRLWDHRHVFPEGSREYRYICSLYRRTKRQEEAAAARVFYSLPKKSCTRGGAV